MKSRRGEGHSPRLKAPVLTAAVVFMHALASLAAEELPTGSIPLLISDHHADHAVFFLRRLNFGANNAAMLLVDAHSDTALNENNNGIRLCIDAGDLDGADALFQNHNWIHPLFSSSLFASLVWIHGLSGSPSSEKLRGFVSSTAQWRNTHPLFARAMNLARLKDFELRENTRQSSGAQLFVSIDLDFFYLDDYTPASLSFVFDALYEYSSCWNGKVVWAVCLSRAWLPSDDYAWELLRQSLLWFSAKSAFAPPELTLFSKNRDGGSMKERAFNEIGGKAPSFYGKASEMPADVRGLLE
ncbi:hypothetical protein ACYULU_03550 [Breznakiellaceae bacterium SP9]